MRDSPVRLLILAIAALCMMAPAVAQENETNTTAQNETTAEAGNETVGNETPTEIPVEEPAGPVTITLETHTEGGGGYFTLEGQTAKNPRLEVQPGQEVIVILRGTDAGVHNFCIGAGQCTPLVTSEGDEQTFTFTAPESGTLEYFCAPHRSVMKGTLAIAGADPGAGDGGETGTITGATVPVGCGDLVAPAIVTTGVVGAPTFEDYKAKCPTSATDAPPTDPYKSIDYVIPISWALVGLGVVGVVWVHKYYKP